MEKYIIILNTGIWISIKAINLNQAIDLALTWNSLDDIVCISNYNSDHKFDN